MPLGSAFVGRQPDYDPANTAAYMFEPDDRVTETSPRPGWPTSCPPEAVGTGHFLQKPGMTGFSAPPRKRSCCRAMARKATGIFLANGTRTPGPVTENRQVLSLKVFSD